MSKPVKISQNQWLKLYNLIGKQYPPSVLLVTWRTREVLGFTPRRHSWFDKENDEYYDEMHLDFYSEPKRTIFLLKYSDILNEKDT